MHIVRTNTKRFQILSSNYIKRGIGLQISREGSLQESNHSQWSTAGTIALAFHTLINNNTVQNTYTIKGVGSKEGSFDGKTCLLDYHDIKILFPLSLNDNKAHIKCFIQVPLVILL